MLERTNCAKLYTHVSGLIFIQVIGISEFYGIQQPPVCSNANSNQPSCCEYRVILGWGPLTFCFPLILLDLCLCDAMLLFILGIKNRQCHAHCPREQFDD